MKKLLLYFLFLSSTAIAQIPVQNSIVRSNPLSPAKVANALDASISYITSGTNTYTISTAAAFQPYAGGGTYASGDIWTITVGNANTSTTVTLNIDSEGAVAVKDNAGNDPAVGDLKLGGTYKLRYNGTHFRILNLAGTGGSSGHTIEEEGTSLTQRTKLNFVGAGVTATDDSGDDASVVTIPLHTVNTSSALTDASTVTITGTKHTLTSDEATITWTLSQVEDFQTTDIILNATTTTWTFPANTLCVYEGVASGDNTAVLSGTSGDHYILSIYKDGTNYRAVIKNFGQ